MDFEKQMIFYLFIFLMEYTMENKTDRKSVGLRIQGLRKRNKETQKDLASVISTTPNSISKLENGEIGLTFDNMILISEHYNVSLDYLCKGEGGSNLLETLNKYVSLDYHDISGVTDNDTVYPLPTLSINRAYFEYLIQTANAKADKNIPEELKTQWLDIETHKFNENIIHDTFTDNAIVVPVKESIINSNPDVLITVSNSKLKDV